MYSYSPCRSASDAFLMTLNPRFLHASWTAVGERLSGHDRCCFKESEKPSLSNRNRTATSSARFELMAFIFSRGLDGMIRQCSKCSLNLRYEQRTGGDIACTRDTRTSSCMQFLSSSIVALLCRWHIAHSIDSILLQQRRSFSSPHRRVAAVSTPCTASSDLVIGFGPEGEAVNGH